MKNQIPQAEQLKERHDQELQTEVRMREDDIWREVFVATMIGKAGHYDRTSITPIVNSASVIADEALERYRKFHDELYFDDDPPEE